MADTRYSVIFTGRLVEGAQPAAVKENLAKLFKVDAERVESMFSGKPIVIKKDLDAEQARSYRAALAKAGAAVTIVEDGGSGAQQATPPPAATAQTSGSAGTPAPDSTPPQPPRVPDLTVADVGVTLVEHEPVTPPDFDTTQFDLAEVGVTLVEPKVVPPAEFDTSGMSLDPPGTQLTNASPTPPAQFDTSGLSLADNE
jgi:hypothetical protein